MDSAYTRANMTEEQVNAWLAALDSVACFEQAKRVNYCATLSGIPGSAPPLCLTILRSRGALRVGRVATTEGSAMAPSFAFS